MNCQAQDISNYRFTLLRAISRNPADGPTDRIAREGGVRRYRASYRAGSVSTAKVENRAIASMIDAEQSILSGMAYP
jgi:hypothetical protein